MTTDFLSCSEAKKMDLTDYLSTLGFLPEKIIRDDYWYQSPLREEKHASFKVNRRKNIWYDFRTGEGGTIIDFGIRYHHCTISEFLHKLQSSFSFHQPPNILESDLAGQKKKIEVIAASSITNRALCHYLKDRNIPLDLAQKYCSEVHYELDGRHYYAIGFPNNSGGYELRNPYFKGSSSPKDGRFIDNGQDSVLVFEGFFSFLSFLVFKEKQNLLLPNLQSNYLILNSLSLFKKSREIMENHQQIVLYLDRDAAGENCTKHALKSSSKYLDGRKIYSGYKDFNDLLVQQNIQEKPVKRIGRRL